MPKTNTMRYAERMAWKPQSKLKGIFEFAMSPSVISFCGGWPDPDLFPADDMAEVAQHVLIEQTNASLQYGLTAGLPALRQAIAEMMTNDGTPTMAENVVVTSGSTQSLDMICHMLLDPGDVVLVESPSYLVALSEFKSYNARLVSIPLDDQGIQVDGLAEIMAKERPKFIYLLPTFQNPTGVSMSLERRQELVRIAAKQGVPVIEDDPYGKLRFEGETPPTLLELDAARHPEANAEGYQAGNVVYLGSFSKTLAPGLRLAWTVSTPDVAQQIATAKSRNDMHSNALAQTMALEYLRRGWLERNIDRYSAAYRERRDAMYAAMDRYFPAGIEHTEPQGGLFLWVTLPQGMDAFKLLERAREFNVAFFPGPSFFADGSGNNTIRLSYAAVLPDEITEGCKRLGNLIASML